MGTWARSDCVRLNAAWEFELVCVELKAGRDSKLVELTCVKLDEASEPEL